MGVISWIILGVLAGFFGGRIVHKSGQGFILNLVIGIVGAIVGGLIATTLGLGGVSGVNLWSILVATGGAVIALVAYDALHAERIRGRNSRDIAEILGTPGRAEMIHRDDMALAGK